MVGTYSANLIAWNLTQIQQAGIDTEFFFLGGESRHACV